MPKLILVLDEPAWPDIADRAVIQLGKDAPPIQIASLAGGMTSGAASIAIRIDLPDGRIVVAETSLRLFVHAAKLLVAKHGDPDPDAEPPLEFIATLKTAPAFVRSGEAPKIWPGECSPACAERLRSYMSNGQHWLCDEHNDPVPTLWTDAKRNLALLVLEEQRGET